MQKRLDDLQHRLQSSTNNPWCKTVSYEIHRLSSTLSNTLPIYRTRLTREQLLSSIKTIQELNLNQINGDLCRRASANYLLLLSIHTHKLVCELFLGEIYHLKRHLHYWKHDDRNQLTLFEQIKTTYWFDQDRDDIRTAEKIKALNAQDDLLADMTGRLAYTITDLEQQEQINLDLTMNYTNQLYQILFPSARSVNYNAHSDLSDAIELYSQMLHAFDDLQVRWIEKTHLYYRPTHFKRYFPYYVCFTAIGCYTLYKVYTNKQEIRDYFSSSYESLKFFISEHLIVPLKTIYSSTFESRASQTTYENSQLNYTNSKKILEEMLEEYGRQHAHSLAELNHVTLHEFLSTLHDRAANEDMNIVMKNYQQELNAPIKSALLGDLIKGILIQVQKVKVDGEGLVIQIDQLMKQNQINFSLLATIPAILLITFLTIATKNIVANRLFKRRKYDLSTLRQQILRKLREIEHVLIWNSETPALMINQTDLIVQEKEEPHDHGDQQMTMSYVTFGYFLSLIYELKNFTQQIKSKRMLSEEFNEDIHLLTHTQLSVKQKRLILEQIYHSYSFLVHSS